MSQVVEVRVHGVSGTPPEQLLDCPLVHQVAGDARAGFYRPRLPEEQHDPRVGPDGQPDSSGPVLEGYAWGGLTSGAASRALWLLLLPFTFVNVAPRLRPGRPPSMNLHLLWYVSRLLAVAMTVLLVVSVAGVGIDLFGWQCSTGGSDPSPDCSAASPKWIMGPLLGMSVEHRLLLGSALPLLVLLVLWKASDRTINNYESVPTIFEGADTKNADKLEPTLDSRWMWRNEYQVRRLRHLHLQAGVTATLWTVSAAFDWSWAMTARVILLALVGGYIATMLWCPAYTGRQPRPRFKLINQIVWAFLTAVAAVIGIALAGSHPLLTRKPGTGLPDYAGTGLTVFIVLLLLYVIFCASIWVMAGRKKTRIDPHAPRVLGDKSSAMIVTLGVFLGAVFASGVYIFAAAWLGTGSLKPSFAAVSRNAIAFDVPDVIGDAARAYAVAVGFLAFFLVAIIVFFAVNRMLRWVKVRRWPSRKYAAALVNDYPNYVARSEDGGIRPPDHPRIHRREQPDDDATVQARGKAIAKTFWLARQVDYAHLYLGGLVSAGVVIMAAFVVLLLNHAGLHVWGLGDLHIPMYGPIRRWHEHVPCGGAPGPCHEGWLWSGWLSSEKLSGTGAYLAVLTLLLMVTVGAAAFRVQKTRKSVGILWDLASFWPRSAHPFAAPCYAERTVPDLTTRIYFHVAQNPAASAVVLAAHSQGTVISAATLFQLKRHDQVSPAQPIVPKVAYLSFGCVLRRLYSRYFPAYFGTPELAKIQTLLTDGDTVRWRNLWRHSDYLGGQVTAGPPPIGVPPADPSAVQMPNAQVEVQLFDPAWPRPDGDTRYERASMHSNYWYDPQFAAQVGVLAAML